MTDQLVGWFPSAGTRARPGAAACRLYLVRHGTTALSTENRYRGRRDIPLDGQGYQDAAQAGRLLSRAGLAAVYTGPLRRAVATARIIADAARVPDVRILPGLNNLDYGAWEGMTAAEAGRHDPEGFALYRGSPSLAACPGGERLIDAQRRVLAALWLMGSRHGGEAVAAVTHAVMVRLILLHVSGIEDESWRLSAGDSPVTEVHVSGGLIELAAVLGGASR
jgi:broad specificity phosphatase PhoE